MARPPLRRPLLILLPPLVLVVLLTLSAADVTCPTKPRQTGCLPSLSTQPSLYSDCLTRPCYLFISEPPFINIPKDLPSPPYRPFNCASPAPFSGLSFEVHKFTPAALCIYAGPNCSFNDLVDFTSASAASNYQFAITGLLVHTPERLCNHSPATPFMEDSMVIIGHAETGRRVEHLVRPFSTLTWMVLVLCFLLICMVAFSIAFVSRGKPSIITAVFVAAGDSAAALRERGEPKTHEEHMVFTKYSLSMSLLKISVVTLITIIALFYEAGVVNFLFQQNTEDFGVRVKSLSVQDLTKYAVLKDSVLEQVWEKVVNPDGSLYDPATEQPPWKRCALPQECTKWVADRDNEVVYEVTFRMGARVLIHQLSSCDTLTVFETKDVHFQFTGGWLYNKQIPTEYRQRTDRMLIGLRVNRTIPNLLEDKFFGEACAVTVDPQLGPVIVAVPICIAVLPLLLASVIMLFCMKEKTKRSEENPISDAVGAPQPIVSEDSKNMSVDLSQLSTSDGTRRTSTLEFAEIEKE